MTAIAKRWVRAVLATTPGDRACLFDLLDNRCHTAASMGAVTVRLAAALAAGTPCMGSRLDIQDVGTALGDFGIGHECED